MLFIFLFIFICFEINCMEENSEKKPLLSNASINYENKIEKPTNVENKEIIIDIIDDNNQPLFNYEVNNIYKEIYNNNPEKPIKVDQESYNEFEKKMTKYNDTIKKRDQTKNKIQEKLKSAKEKLDIIKYLEISNKINLANNRETKEKIIKETKGATLVSSIILGSLTFATLLFVLITGVANHK